MKEKQVLILIRGPAGVGKSTISKALKRKKEGLVHLDVDSFKHLISKESSKTRTEIAHEVGSLFLQKLLEKGYSVVIEELFREKEYKEILKKVKKFKILVLKVFLKAPKKVLYLRDANRGKNKGKAVISKLHGIVKESGEDIVIDTSKVSVAEAVKKILLEIEKK